MSETPPQAHPNSTTSTSSAASTSMAKRFKPGEEWPADTPRDLATDAQLMPTPRMGEIPTDKAQGQGPFAKWQIGADYDLKKVLGQGSYGEVAEAIQKKTGQRVAIKRIHNVFDMEIDTKRILREVNILRQLKDDRIVKLLDVIPPKDLKDFNELYLVFEFVDTDLHKLIQAPQYLSIDHVKHFLYQLLCAVRYMHSACVIHRDIKPANILLNEDCSLKVCDFGLSRVLQGKGKSAISTEDVDTSKSDANGGGGAVQPTPPSARPLQRQLTKHVVTRWYRPPELILLQEYSTPVDVWSVGCIFAELLSMLKANVPVFSDRMPLFPGRSCFPLSADSDKTYKDQLDQLNVIFDVIGTPTEDDIKNLGDVQNYLKTLQKKEPRDLQKTFPAAPPQAIDLLKRMLMFNPEKRITVEEALAHAFLDSVRDQRKEKVAKGPIISIEDLKLTPEGLRERLLEEVAFYTHKPSNNGK